nr:hypothetical protein [Tanacetum cinerariifolium]
MGFKGIAKVGRGWFLGCDQSLDCRGEMVPQSYMVFCKEINGLRQDRAVVVSKVVSHVAMKLVYSDELGFLVAHLVKAAMFHGRYTAFEEVTALEEPFILQKMPSYHSSSKKDFDQVDDDLPLSFMGVTVGMVDRSEGLEYAEFLAGNYKYSFSELLPIIKDDYLGYSESAHDMFPYKFLHMLPCCRYYGFCFDPFCEVIDSHDEEPCTSWCHWQRSYNVNSLLRKRYCFIIGYLASKSPFTWFATNWESTKMPRILAFVSSSSSLWIASFLSGASPLFFCFTGSRFLCRKYDADSPEGVELYGSMYCGYYFAHPLHGLSPIVIFKKTSPRGQECSPEKPTSRTFEYTLRRISLEPLKAFSVIVWGFIGGYLS